VLRRSLRHDGLGRRLALGAGVYVVATAVYFACAARETLTEHTPFNHFALLARAWLEGHLDLRGGPPGYAQNNDFAHYDGRWFIVFPPFPAVLLLPCVLFGGAPENVQDGQVFLWLAGAGPAALFLVLEKLRVTGVSERLERDNVILSLLFAFGTVYFFSAEQGTVWYAAHVVSVVTIGCYLLFAIGAERPFLAGLALALGVATRTPLLLAFPFFVFEAFKAASREVAFTGEGTAARLRALLGALDRRAFFTKLSWFALPLACVLLLFAWHNQARFDSPFEFGYRYLTVRWQARMNEWGLFHYHYLGKNLGVALTSLPFWTPDGPAPFRVNGHGLALWFTTPLYLWVLWPRRVTPRYAALAVTVAVTALPTLFYQNTGWVQFGYRFSNDYAPLLFVLLALGGRRFGRLFFVLALWSVAVNAFGAVTFARSAYRDYYFIDATQRVIHQPD
jgi:hypothetical protein